MGLVVIPDGLKCIVHRGLKRRGFLILAISPVTKGDKKAEKITMDIQTLDFIFPFFVLMYGALVTVVLNIPQLEKIAAEKFTHEIYNQLKGHRTLALVCLFVGTFWSLQNLWAGSGALFSF